MKPSKVILIIAVIVAICGVGYALLTMPDQRTTGQRIGDAIDALPQGVDKAGQQLEKRTPGERLGDAMKDAGDSVKKNTSRP
ncbi:MAG TPA: hypothetical protein VFT64_04555 [Rickettsiales bacterium]|nr:hypothetical protein [Rickettsiales bacterium]